MKTIIFNGKVVRTEDCTPTHLGLLPLYVEQAASGNNVAKAALENMAKSADNYGRLCHINKEQNDQINQMAETIESLRNVNKALTDILNQQVEDKNRLQKENDALHIQVEYLDDELSDALDREEDNL